MGLHPDVKKYLESSLSDPYDEVKTNYNQVREWLEKTMQSTCDPPSVREVEDLVIQGPEGNIPIRIYTPDGTGPFPILVFFHGGGFVLGSIAGYDVTCRKITRETGHKVISVGYRLAPENPFPSAPEDCYAATKWVAENAIELQGDVSRISIAGTSAGGNLTAVVSMMSRDRGTPNLYKQVLIYPVTDYYEQGLDSPYHSYEMNGKGYNLTSKAMDGFWSLYLNKTEDRNHPYASPIRSENLSGLPPALIITAEFDPVRDEGEEYGKRLQEFGIPVKAVRYEGMIHGFLKFNDSEPTKEAYDQTSKFLRS